MTIEEAIKHCEEVAEKLKHRFDYYLEAAKSPKLKEKEQECLECAKEHQQLAEWLKELKAYEDAREEIIRKRDSGQWSETVVFGLNRAIYTIDKHLKEVNADED